MNYLEDDKKCSDCMVKIISTAQSLQLMKCYSIKQKLHIHFVLDKEIPQIMPVSDIY